MTTPIVTATAATVERRHRGINYLVTTSIEPLTPWSAIATVVTFPPTNTLPGETVSARVCRTIVYANDDGYVIPDYGPMRFDTPPMLLLTLSNLLFAPEDEQTNLHRFLTEDL